MDTMVTARIMALSSSSSSSPPRPSTSLRGTTLVAMGALLLLSVSSFRYSRDIGLMTTAIIKGTATEIMVAGLDSDPKSSSSSFWMDPFPDNRTFFGVHLGKAGGSTVFANMRGILLLGGGWHPRHEQFLEKVKQQGPNEMAASNKTIGVMHMVELTNPQKINRRAKANTFLWVIRDPMDRIASAFYYEHPVHNKVWTKIPPGKYHLFHSQCYTHVDDFVRDYVGLTTNPKVAVNRRNKTIICSELAQEVMTPFRPEPTVRWNDYRTWSHLNKNYEFYYRETNLKFPKKDNVIIRTEHMWDDLQQLEYSLGGNATVSKQTHIYDSHGSENFKLKKKLTDPVLLQKFCCAIRREAEIYMELLQKAINLQPWQKKESLDAFAQRCNLELCDTGGEQTKTEGK